MPGQGESEPADEKLPIGFEQSLQAVPKFGPIQYEDCEGAEILPIMPLAAVKFPTDKVALQLFEPRYRAMIKLVNQTPRKRFGIVLGDRLNATMESVGCVCVIEEYVPLPTRRRILIDARAIGRFRVHKILLDKPFITAVVQEIADAPPASIVEEATLASLEMRVREYMQDVEALAKKLYGHLGSVTGSTVRSDLEASKDVYVDGRETGVHDAKDGTRERFSFALLRTLDGLSLEDKQELLECQSTSTRLQRIESDLLEGRRYLAARSTLRDTLS